MLRIRNDTECRRYVWYVWYVYYDDIPFPVIFGEQSIDEARRRAGCGRGVGVGCGTGKGWSSRAQGKNDAHIVKVLLASERVEHVKKSTLLLQYDTAVAESVLQAAVCTLSTR